MNSQVSESLDMNIMSNYCKYLNKKVVLKTVRDTHMGSLKCIDPLSQSVVLIVDDIESNACKVLIVMSHSIKSIELVDELIDCNESAFDLKPFLSTPMGSQTEQTFSEQELKQRKSQVIEWFTENHIPVQEVDDGSLVIAYALSLTVPYFKEQCICGNEMVLSKVQSLLESMPANK